MENTQLKTRNEQKATFEIGDLRTIALVLVVTGILIAFGLDVLSDVKADFTAGTAEYNATADTVSGISKLSSKLPLIGTVVVAAVLIGILVRYLARSN